MLAVGILASRFEGSVRAALPIAFIASMSIGAVLATSGFALASVELVIALSLIAFGAAIVSTHAPPVMIATVAVAAFALFHGYAHGTEMAGTSLLAFGTGFVLSTALLHGAGLWLTLRARELGRRAQTAIHVSGGVIAGIGVVLTFG